MLNEPKGSKYEEAKMWKIIVVKSEWVYDSIEAGYCLPEESYVLEPEHQDTCRLASEKSILSSIGDTSVAPDCLPETDVPALTSNSTAKLQQCQEQQQQHEQSSGGGGNCAKLELVDLVRSEEDKSRRSRPSPSPHRTRVAWLARRSIR